MLFNVPQFLDIEDKIFGPFTAKQLGWMGAGGVVLLILWNLFETSTFIVLAIIDCAIVGALAFYRPYNQSLIKFIMSSIYFMFHPQVYVWKRNYDNMNIRKAPAPVKKEKITERKKVSREKIKELAEILNQNNGKTSF
jgi:hypothetical protein